MVQSFRSCKRKRHPKLDAATNKRVDLKEGPPEQALRRLQESMIADEVRANEMLRIREACDQAH